MRLVDSDQREPLFPEHLNKARHAQPLRRNKQELQRALQIIHASLPRLRALQARMNPRRAQAKG